MLLKCLPQNIRKQLQRPRITNTKCLKQNFEIHFFALFGFLHFPVQCELQLRLHLLLNPFILVIFSFLKVGRSPYCLSFASSYVSSGEILAPIDDSISCESSHQIKRCSSLDSQLQAIHGTVILSCLLPQSTPCKVHP